MVLDGESIAGGGQEAEWSYSQPQAQSKKIKLEMGPGYELSKATLHDITSSGKTEPWATAMALNEG